MKDGWKQSSIDHIVNITDGMTDGWLWVADMEKSM